MTFKDDSAPRGYIGNSECSGDEWSLVMGETYAFRSWIVDGRGRLRSPQQNHFIWKSGENVAFDRKTTDSRNTEGFYAYTDKPTWNGDVTGVIKAYGYVTEGTRGIVAEKAEIVALCTNRPDGVKASKFATKLADRLAKDDEKANYGKVGVPVGILGVLAFLGALAILFTPVKLLALPFFVVAFGIGWLIYTMLTAEMLIDNAGGKEKWNKHGTKAVYSLRELYPNVQFYRSKGKMLADYREKIVPVKPEPPLTGPDDEKFWDAENED